MVCPFASFPSFYALHCLQCQDFITAGTRCTKWWEMLGREANQHMVSSSVLCGLHSHEPGTLTQAFQTFKIQEYSQFLYPASSQEVNRLERWKDSRGWILNNYHQKKNSVTDMLWANLVSTGNQNSCISLSLSRGRWQKGIKNPLFYIELLFCPGNRALPAYFERA